MENQQKPMISSRELVKNIDFSYFWADGPDDILDGIWMTWMTLCHPWMTFWMRLDDADDIWMTFG